jgi:hypothetical protein
MTSAELQTAFETDLTPVVNTLSGRGTLEDWALVRALVHKAVHLAAERRLDYCAVSTLMAEMTQHAHQLMHAGQGHSH